MPAANAMEVQRNVVVRTKSGSFTKNKPSALDIVIIAEQSAAAACVATPHGGALLPKVSAMGLGPPLNSVLESKLNHDLLQQGCCQAGEASGCLVELPARLGIKIWIPGSDFRARCFRQIVFPQLKFFFIGKSRFDLPFLASGSALRRRFSSGQIMTAMASLFGTSEAEHGDACRTPSLPHQPVSVEMVQKSAKVGASVMASDSALVANRKPKRRFQQRGPHAIC